ncbi:hypothetical protein ACP275_12G014500 [Erythranthe tilingii]
MSLKLQSIFTNKNPTTSSASLSSPPPHFLKPYFNLPFPPPNSPTHSPISTFSKPQPHLLLRRVGKKINASSDEAYAAIGVAPNPSSLDAFLSVVEFLSLASSAAVSVYVALSGGVLKRGVLVLGSRILVWQCVVLVSGVLVGAAIRRRQWRRICGAAAPSGVNNLSARVEKVEEDLRSSATIIRVLSRQLDKLGSRFRVTRKALKEPVSETAALAQKNSEATRALAAQEDILENELGEIQNVLLAMQEQQQKQLELIIALGKAGKLWETKSVPTKDHNASDRKSKSSVDGAPNSENKSNRNSDISKVSHL